MFIYADKKNNKVCTTKFCQLCKCYLSITHISLCTFFCKARI